MNWEMKINKRAHLSIKNVTSVPGLATLKTTHEMHCGDEQPIDRLCRYIPFAFFGIIVVVILVFAYFSPRVVSWDELTPEGAEKRARLHAYDRDYWIRKIMEEDHQRSWSNKRGTPAVFDDTTEFAFPETDRPERECVFECDRA